MVSVLLESSGLTCLMEDFGNPFSFFRRYTEAAKHSNGKYPLFSPESISLITELEERYAR